jgi:hypothetical protein
LFHKNDFAELGFCDRWFGDAAPENPWLFIRKVFISDPGCWALSSISNPLVPWRLPMGYRKHSYHATNCSAQNHHNQWRAGVIMRKRPQNPFPEYEKARQTAKHETTDEPHDDC